MLYDAECNTKTKAIRLALLQRINRPSRTEHLIRYHGRLSGILLPDTASCIQKHLLVLVGAKAIQKSFPSATVFPSDMRMSCLAI